MTRCPMCTSRVDFDAIGNHWARACTFPHPSARERELFVGIWLAGGNLEWGENPRIRKRSRHERPLQWLHDQAGPWSSSVKSHTRLHDSDIFRAENDAPYRQEEQRWTSVACPWLDNLADASPDQVDDWFGPLAARIFISFKGHQPVPQQLRISHKQHEAVAVLLHEAGFDGATTDRNGRAGYVSLDIEPTRRLFEWIGGPIPGFEDKFDLQAVFDTSDSEPAWRDKSTLQDYCEGNFTTTEIQEALGCSRYAVEQGLDEHDLSVSPPAEYPLLADPGWLRDQYHGEVKSPDEIAADVGCPVDVVTKWMHEYGILRRPDGRRIERRDATPVPDDVDPSWLREQVEQRGRTQTALSDELGVSQPRVSDWMDELGIEAAGHDVAYPRLTDENWLREKYTENGEGLSQSQIAEKVGCSPSTVWNMLKKHGIETRDPGF